MPLPKPTDDFEWATTALNVVQPSTGKQQAGWAEGERPPASFVNWLYQTVGLWLAYVNTLFVNRSTDYDTGPSQVGPELRLGPNGEIRIGVEQVDATNLDEAELRLTTDGSVLLSGLRADVLRSDAVVVGLDDPDNQASFRVAPGSPAGAGVTVALADEGAAQAALLVNTLAISPTPAAHVPRDVGLSRDNVVKAYCALTIDGVSSSITVSLDHSYNVTAATYDGSTETFSVTIADNAGGLIVGKVQASLVCSPPSATDPITLSGFSGAPIYVTSPSPRIIFFLTQDVGGGVSGLFGSTATEARVQIYLELY